MKRKHYTKADFIITFTGDGVQMGYCRICKSDMQILRDGILRHYRSHTTYRKRGK